MDAPTHTTSEESVIQALRSCDELEIEELVGPVQHFPRQEIVKRKAEGADASPLSSTTLDLLRAFMLLPQPVHTPNGIIFLSAALPAVPNLTSASAYSKPTSATTVGATVATVPSPLVAQKPTEAQVLAALLSRMHTLAGRVKLLCDLIRKAKRDLDSLVHYQPLKEEVYDVEASMVLRAVLEALVSILDSTASIIWKPPHRSFFTTSPVPKAEPGKAKHAYFSNLHQGNMELVPGLWELCQEVREASRFMVSDFGSTTQVSLLVVWNFIKHHGSVSLSQSKNCRTDRYALYLGLQRPDGSGNWRVDELLPPFYDAVAKWLERVARVLLRLSGTGVPDSFRADFRFSLMNGTEIDLFR